MATQDTGIWQDTSTLGSQSFTADYKNNGWNYFPMTQMLMKDSGATLRNLFFTTELVSSQTMRAFWTARQWLANGTDTASSAYAAGRLYSLAIANYNVDDAILRSSGKTRIIFKWGERDGVQDGNKDRSMIAGHRHDTSDNVDGPAGIGCFTYHDGTQGGPVQRARDMVSYTVYGAGEDEPPNGNGGSTTYNYTLWVR
jgi:hypothetical protein